MIWADVMANWPQTLELLQLRFPNLSYSQLPEPPTAHATLANIVAQTHDLTLLEAAEEISDWLYVAGLDSSE